MCSRIDTMFMAMADGKGTLVQCLDATQSLLKNVAYVILCCAKFVHIVSSCDMDVIDFLNVLGPGVLPVVSACWGETTAHMQALAEPSMV